MLSAEAGRIEELVTAVNRRMQTWHDRQPDTKAPLGCYCLWWARATTIVLRQAGFNAQIQAGTALWRIVDDKDDDGVSPNHFGYVFETKMENIRRLASGMMPEMHCWVGILTPEDESPILVDLTTSYWPERCQVLLGRNWTAKHPPKYLWAPIDDIPYDCRYTPDFSATHMAYQMMSSHSQNV